MTERALLLGMMMISAACAPDDPRPAAQSANTTSDDEADEPEGVPTEHFGSPCAPGVRCDESSMTSQRDPCEEPTSERCPCTTDTPPVACDVDTNGSVTPITCWIGQRTCVAGMWNRCTAYSARFN